MAILLKFLTVLIVAGASSYGYFSTHKQEVIESSDTQNLEQETANEISAVNKKEVERYGIVVTNSSSGSLRLRYYDIEQKKVLDSWQGYLGFWASIEDIEDRKGGIELFEYAERNKGAVFKIVGKKDEDDCQYAGNGGPCLENIVIKQIEALAN